MGPLGRIANIAIAVACAGQLLSCAADPASEEPEPEVTTESDPLIGVAPDFWKNFPAPNSLPWIQACWASGSLASQYDALRASVQSVIERAWERWGRLNIVWSPTACPATQLEGTIKYAFTENSSIGGLCGGTPFKRQITINSLLAAGGSTSPPAHWVAVYGSNASNVLIRATALHETAHCIGFDHGERMPPPNGPPNPACTLVATGAGETEPDMPNMARFGAYNMFESKINVCADNQPATFTNALQPVDIAALQRAYGAASRIAGDAGRAVRRVGRQRFR